MAIDGLLGNNAQQSQQPRLGGTSGADSINMLLGVTERLAERPKQEAQAQQMQQLVAQASQLFREGVANQDQGKLVEAVILIAPFAPKDHPLLQAINTQIGVEQDITKAQRTPKSSVLEAEEGIFEISGAPGKAQAKLLRALKPKSADEEKLSDKQQVDLSEAGNGVEGIKVLQNLATSLVNENRIGPLAGRKEQLLSALDLASPESAQFQNLRQFMALGLAAEQNQGRPTDADFKAAERLLARMSNNPDTAIFILLGARAQLERSRDNKILTSLAASTPGQRPAVERVAKVQNVDIAKAQKIRQLSENSGLPETKIRQGILLLKEFAKNPNLSSFSGSEVKRLMDQTMVILEENELVDELVGN